MNLKKRPTLFVLFLLFSTFGYAFADTAESTPTVIKNHTSKAKTNTTDATSNTIIVHKPAADPSWGKVIQFTEEQALSPSEHSKETLYKFLFQDSQDVVRLAIYHESASGTGYWEVWIWDQP